MGSFVSSVFEKRPYFDIVVVTPLEEELDEFTTLFPLKDDFSTDHLFRSSVESGTDGIAILVIQQAGMGRTHARNALASVLQDFNVGLAVCLGIAGSLTDDLNLGDVCYSATVFDVYDNIKAEDINDDAFDLSFSPVHFSVDRTLVAAINFLRLKKDLKPAYQEWQAERSKVVSLLVPEPVLGRSGRNEKLGPPKARDGVLACAHVSKSDSYNKRLKRVDRKVLAVETESGGLFELAHSSSTAALTIRGISDHADDAKNRLETQSNGAVRKAAASNAASFLKLQVNANPHFRQFLIDRKKRFTENLLDKMVSLRVEKNRTPNQVVTDAAASIDIKLRELSPEFRLQPKGYRLPVPRIRQIELNNALGDASQGDPEYFADILSAKNSLLLTVPRTYPDNGLPWVIADNLLGVELGGRQAIPIVINGTHLGPPKSGLAQLASCRTDDIDDADGFQLVYILENVPAASKSKLGFLKREIAAAIGAKFIFITRGEDHLLELVEFASEQSADKYEMCPISFREIAHFLEKNFSMSGTESEVVALRLRNTFEQFSLSAHPTYFAGIPKEILSALLQANRRAELLQLAVDGFLTFVVAGDTADVALSRTTRAQFLRNLVVELKVEKRSYTQSQLVEFTSAFSIKYDFAIDPLAFIQSFVDKGILHFNGEGVVEFSLPFIGSYLLAVELSRQPKLVERYFQFQNEDFDYSAFDLYAEIGASDELVRRFCNHLKDQIEAADLRRDGEHVLLTNRIHPKFLSSDRRMHAVHKKLRQTLKDVRKMKGDVKAKQRILDLADRVKENAAKTGQKLEDTATPKPEGVISLTALGRAIQTWAVGVVLLGSGAEHLTAEVKRDLARKLVSLASQIIHHWTELQLSVDFDKLKAEITKDEFVREFAQQTNKAKGRDEKTALRETRSFIKLLVDVIELEMLSAPFRRVTAHLCENARQRVLATSVEHAEFSDPIESVLHSAWLTDIESKRGKVALARAIKALPKAPFLRTNLATHFLTRVHWNHWNKQDRYTLLDAAEQAIAPLALTFNKGELKRVIDSSVDGPRDQKATDDD